VEPCTEGRHVSHSDYVPLGLLAAVQETGAGHVRIVLFFVTNTFIKTLNKIVVPVLELPLGFYMPVQAAMIVFAVMLFWFARATR
jgi:putative solute:sodium symporter small subunit